MALPKKKKLGQKTTVSAQRTFTDREEFQESFKKALVDVDNQELSILTFYGVGGVGKSSLQKHLKEQHLDRDENSIYSWVDFEEHSSRATHKAFRTLVNNFKSKFKISFTTFDLAYMIYFSKAFPEYEIKKKGLPFLEEGSQLSDIVDQFSELGDIAGIIFGILGYMYKKKNEFSFDATIRDELKLLNTLEADAIESKLGEFFAYDIDKYKEKNPSKRVVIFLDTYEALWRDNSSDENQFSQDEWVRSELIANLLNTLFVICGREKIAWSKYDEDWEEVLSQHILGHLSELDSKTFLKSCNILDNGIQDNIYKASEGYPYYLDLCVDTYEEIERSGETPRAEDFNNLNKDKIFNRFMQSLNRSEIKTNILYSLSHARFYTKEIFKLLLGNQFTNSDMQRINNFSFVSEDNGIYYIHNIMRESLIASPNNAEKEDANTILFEHYNSYLQDLDIKNISQGSMDALPEAFYHKEQISDMEELANWFQEPFSEFEKAAKYKVILETTIRLKDLQEKVLGEDHPDTATSYNNLAGLYDSMGKYEEALPLYEKSLKISQKVLGEEHSNTATSYNNLALLYMSMGKYEEALPLLKKSLEISQKVLGEEHPDTATSYNNLAGLYYNLGNIDDALATAKQGLGENSDLYKQLLSLK